MFLRIIPLISDHPALRSLSTARIGAIRQRLQAARDRGECVPTVDVGEVKQRLRAVLEDMRKERAGSVAIFPGGRPHPTDCGEIVRTIARRLQRLEEGFRLGPETEEDRRLRERLESARRRAAERRACEGLPPLETDKRQREDLTGLSIVEILQRGCTRAHARAGNEHA
jgi:hypothetical protein